MTKRTIISGLAPHQSLKFPPPPSQMASKRPIGVTQETAETVPAEPPNLAVTEPEKKEDATTKTRKSIKERFPGLFSEETAFRVKTAAKQAGVVTGKVGKGVGSGLLGFGEGLFGELKKTNPEEVGQKLGAATRGALRDLSRLQVKPTYFMGKPTASRLDKATQGRMVVILYEEYPELYTEMYNFITSRGLGTAHLVGMLQETNPTLHDKIKKEAKEYLASQFTWNDVFNL